MTIEFEPGLFSEDKNVYARLKFTMSVPKALFERPDNAALKQVLLSQLDAYFQMLKNAVMQEDFRYQNETISFPSLYAVAE